MSHTFKLRFDQMRDNNPAEPEQSDRPVAYGPADRPRNLGLVWPDGRHYFLNYAYLVAGELRKDGEKNIIQLQFSSHLVTLMGYGLEALFLDIVDLRTDWIVVEDERYTAMNDAQTAVIDVQIETKT